MDRTERERMLLETVRTRSGAMYRIALSMLRVPQDAEDAVSAAVEVAWRRLDHVRDAGALPAYLIRCTVNSCRATLRRRGREAAVGELEPLMPPTRDPSPVWELLGGLPEKYRLPLMLRYAEDMPVVEVARALRLTRSGAQSRIGRGLRMLRDEMEEVSDRD